MKKDKDKRKADFTSGKGGTVSGREMFEFNPDMVGVDTADGDDGENFDLSQFKSKDDDEVRYLFM